MRFRWPTLPGSSLIHVGHSVEYYVLGDFLAASDVVGPEYEFMSSMDNLYFTRKPWKKVTKAFIGQIVGNMGGELE